MGVAREDGTIDISKPRTFKTEMNLNMKEMENAKSDDIARVIIPLPCWLMKWRGPSPLGRDDYGVLARSPT